MKLQEQRWVDRPIEQVFEYTADFTNIENWDPGVESSSKVGNDPVDVGTKYELDVTFGSSTIPMIYEITVYEAPNRVVLVGVGEKLTAVDEIVFTTKDNLTHIEYTADLTFGGVIRYLVPFMSSKLKKVGTDALDGLELALSR